MSTSTSIWIVFRAVVVVVGVCSISISHIYLNFGHRQIHIFKGQGAKTKKEYITIFWQTEIKAEIGTYTRYDPSNNIDSHRSNEGSSHIWGRHWKTDSVRMVPNSSTPTLKHPTFDWSAASKYSELRSFILEVNNIFETYHDNPIHMRYQALKLTGKTRLTIHRSSHLEEVNAKQ